MLTATPQTIKPGTRLERSFVVERAAVDAEARTVQLAFASETPVERWWGREILDCTATSMRMSRLTTGGPLLCDHNTRDHIGVIESVEVGADRVARAVVRFGRSERAQEVFADVQDGIRRNVSVGYVVHKAQLVETGDDQDTYRVTDWEPFEVSLVSVPADPAVGVGRSLESREQRLESPLIPLQENRQMDPVIEVQPPSAAALAEQRAAALKEERERVAMIGTIAESFKREDMLALGRRCITEGLSVDAFRAEAMTLIASKPVGTNDLGLSDKESRSYSLMRAIRAMVDRDWKEAGFERELSQEIAKRHGIEPQNGGFYVPTDIQKRALTAQRDLTVATATAGGNLVATNLLPSSFIELLRARSVMTALGARVLTGLVGNVAIPKQTGAGTAYWLANEATAITENQQTFGQVPLAPKTIGAYTEISRLLMMQSTPAADALVMDDLAKVLALGIDLAAISGSGASGQPTGIINSAGIGSVSGTTLGYAGIIEFQTDTANSNALASNSAYLTTPNVAALLMQRQRFASTDTPLWKGSVLDGEVCGFQGMTTTQMAAASMLFGDFSQVVIGEWGLLEIALNPYANFTAAISGIRAIQTVDVAIRQASAFSLATNIT